jgi:hypothetical protein
MLTRGWICFLLTLQLTPGGQSNITTDYSLKNTFFVIQEANNENKGLLKTVSVLISTNINTM